MDSLLKNCTIERGLVKQYFEKLSDCMFSIMRCVFISHEVMRDSQRNLLYNELMPSFKYLNILFDKIVPLLWERCWKVLFTGHAMASCVVE